MRSAHTMVMAAALTAVALSGPSAAAQTIPVTPGSPHPGQRVHISVPGCGTGNSTHTAMSAAFTGAVTLYGKSDTGEADPTIRRDARPGTYPITAFCGVNRTVRGQVVVARAVPSPATGGAPSASPSPAASIGAHGSSAAYWVLGAIAVALAGGAGIMLVRARGADHR